MKEILKKEKKYTIWTIIALILGSALVAEPLIYESPDGMVAALKWYGCMFALVIGGGCWITLFVIIFKLAAKKICEKYSVWMFALIYIVLVNILGLVKYDSELFYHADIYEMVMILVNVVLYPFLASTLLGIYNVHKKSKELSIRISAVLIFMFTYNIMWAMQIDFLSYVVVGLVQAYTLTKALCILADNRKKSAQAIGTIGISILWINAFIIVFGGYQVIQTAIRVVNTLIDDYRPFSESVTKAEMTGMCTYFVVAILALVALSKVISGEYIKNSSFYLAYKAAWIYLIARNLLLLWLWSIDGDMSNFNQNDLFLLPDLITVAIIISAFYMEKEIISAQKEIEKYQLVSVKEVFGEGVGEELIIEKETEDSFVVVLKDENTGHIEVLNRVAFVEYKSEFYRLFALADDEEKMMVLKNKTSMQDKDIESEYVEVDTDEDIEKISIKDSDSKKMEPYDAKKLYLTEDDQEALEIFEIFIFDSKKELEDEFLYV